MTTEQSPILRLGDVVAALEKRGRQQEAEYYREVYPFFLGMMYGLDEDTILDMTLDELSDLPNIPQKPLKYEEWDSFYFGRAAFGDPS